MIAAYQPRRAAAKTDRSVARGDPVGLLQALLATPAQWQYGYELSKQTGLRSGTLHPILMRLADQHLLETRWEPPQRPGLPARQIYRLTAAGRQLAIDRLARPADAARRAPARPVPDGAG